MFLVTKNRRILENLRDFWPLKRRIVAVWAAPVPKGCGPGKKRMEVPSPQDVQRILRGSSVA